MSIENDMRPEGVENFKAPEDKPKKKTLLEKMRGSKLARTLGLGAALTGGAIMNQEKAQAMDGRDAIWAAQNTVRDVMEYKTQKARIEAQKQRDAQRHREQMEREANRARQDQLRRQEQLEREKTQRQDNALRTAERTGATKIKTATVGEETEVSLTPGTTPEERMQAERNLHERDMREIEQQQNFIRNNPDLQRKIKK